MASDLYTRSITEYCERVGSYFYSERINALSNIGFVISALLIYRLFKNKKVKGLTIMWGLRQTSVREWRYGKILDPKSGNIYSCEIHVAANGKTLEIRGYIGFSLFGRTQTWIRDLPEHKKEAKKG